MDYQTEKAIEQKAISDLANGIAKIMGWKCEPIKEDNRCCYIISPDGSQYISICLVWNHKDRALISGSFYQQGLHSHLPYKADNPEITVAISRGPEAIAKEITRRVLPGYKLVLEQAQQNKNRTDAHEAQVNSNATELLAVLADQSGVRQGRQSDTFFFQGGEVSVSADSARLKLDLSIEQAKAVLQFIQKGAN